MLSINGWGFRRHIPLIVTSFELWQGTSKSPINPSEKRVHPRSEARFGHNRYLKDQIYILRFFLYTKELGCLLDSEGGLYQTFRSLSGKKLNYTYFCFKRPYIIDKYVGIIWPY